MPSGRAGQPAVFSDAAIQFCLTLKCMFGLGLRQTTGLADTCPIARDAPAKPCTKARNMEPINQATREGDGVDHPGSDQFGVGAPTERVLLVDVIQALDDDPVPHWVVKVLMGPDASIQ